MREFTPATGRDRLPAGPSFLVCPGGLGYNRPGVYRPGHAPGVQHVPIDLTVVVPTYNERENVAPLVGLLDKALEGVAWEVLFVDDDSPDGTADAVRELASRDVRVRCLQRIGRRGLSSACIEGIMASAAPYVAVMDADLQHDESVLPGMLEKLRTDAADVVVGSRYMGGGSTGELASGRVWISRVASALGQLVLKARVSDPMSGFFMLQRVYFDRVAHDLSGKGFKILLDLLASGRRDVRVAELPYHMRARQHGDSKLDTMVVWEYLVLIADKLFGRYVPVRFVLFVGVGMTGVAVHLLVLGLLHRLLAVDFLVAQASATLFAMTSNYFLNNVFTYHDQRLYGAALVRGLATFYLACSIGAVISVEFATFLFERSFPWFMAGFFGAIAGAVWNYAVTATFTWRATRPKSVAGK
ncbi:MAG: glycosyltransferase family 2 protein [Gammaproteobacteria bacterium]|nr:MAG: glycosyltransferase family 2 protein [Gammaproteobacteria bacterium]